MQQADIGQLAGFAAAADAVGGVSVELTGPLDAEEVGVGLKPGLLDEERALARADLEFEGTARVVEPLARIEAAGFAVDGDVVGQRRQFDADAFGRERFAVA